MKRMMMGAGLLLTIVTSAAWAEPFTLTMGELPFQPVDGLSVEGVTFHFTVGGMPSTDAFFDSLNGGQQVLTQDPVIEGDAAGVLTIDFAKPTSFLSFGVSESTPAPLTPGSLVELFDSNLMSLGTTPINTAPIGLDFFTEGQFNYTGAPVSRAVITFDPAAGRFGFDNLVFDGTVTNSAPAAGTAGIVGLTLVLLALGSIRVRSSLT